MVDEVLFADGSEWQSDNWKRDHPKAEPYRDPEAYEVYNAIIPEEETYQTGKGALIISQTTEMGGSNLCFEDDIGERFDEALTDFLSQNTRPWLLQRQFQSSRPYEIISARGIGQLFKNDDRQGGWGHFYSRFPHSGGFSHLSAVGFYKTRTLAVVHAGSESGNMGGSRGLYVLLKVNGKWEIAHYGCREMS